MGGGISREAQACARGKKRDPIWVRQQECAGGAAGGSGQCPEFGLFIYLSFLWEPLHRLLALFVLKFILPRNTGTVLFC
jgi:hypothetical protein